MQINLITVGKLSEKYWIDAQREYLKRLSRFCKIKEDNIDDFGTKIPGVVVLKKESENIIKILDKNKQKNYIILLDVEGELISSKGIANKIDTLPNLGYSKMTFIIGGSLGVSEDIRKRADLKISFGRVTYTHQMFKIMLLEQIYRGYKIINNEPYNK